MADASGGKVEVRKTRLEVDKTIKTANSAGRCDTQTLRVRRNSVFILLYEHTNLGAVETETLFCVFLFLCALL